MLNWLPPALQIWMVETIAGVQLPAGQWQARLAFDWPTIWIVVALAGVIAVAAWYARAESGRGRQPLKLFLLRAGWLTLIVVALAGPRLIVDTTQPQPSVSAVLVDSTLSMRAEDVAGEARHTLVRPVLSALQKASAGGGANDRRQVQLFGFDVRARAVADLNELTFDAPYTSLAGSLDGLEDQVRGGLLTSVLIASDGGFALADADRRALSRLRALGVRIHVLDTARAASGDDIAIERISAPRRIRAGSAAQIDVLVRHTRAQAASRPANVDTDDTKALTTELVLEQDGRSFGNQTLTLTPGGLARAQFAVPFTDGGIKRLVVRAAPLTGERNVLNNDDSALVQVDAQPLKVLHLEGEPRFEVKFIRRAVHDDAHIALGSLVRTAENKLYRIGPVPVTQDNEALPRTPEALFTHDVLIIGSVPRDMLTPPTIALLDRFVAERGGGVMFLGGRYAFGEGGLDRTRLTHMLPLTLGPRAGTAPTLVRVELTDVGARHSVARLAAGGANILPAAQLPMLTSINRSIRDGVMLKPGAGVLWRGVAAQGGQSIPLLVEQRYGRGHVAMLGVRDMWRWQMHRSLPLTDQSHEYFWRQWLRWMARDAHAPLHLELDRQNAAPGQNVTLFATALNAAYVADPALSPRIEVIAPSGQRSALSLAATGVGGRWRASFTPSEDGLHEFELALADDEVKAATAFLDVSALGREAFSHPHARHTLSLIAEAGGGRLVDAGDLDSLDAVLDGPRRTRPRQVSVALWNSPLLFGLLLVLLAGEWIWRRRHLLP